MMAGKSIYWHLEQDEDGATVMEFGLIAVVFITLLLGLFDMGQTAYVRAILDGAVEEAARTSALETGDTTVADQKIAAMLDFVAPGADVTTQRRSYYDFADVERAESWNDANANDTCDNNETYTDENGNGQWDEDIGEAGNGGAGDVVIYTVTVSYDPLFPNPFWSGGSTARNISATAVKKNQPFADQARYGSTAGNCSS